MNEYDDLPVLEGFSVVGYDVGRSFDAVPEQNEGDGNFLTDTARDLGVGVIDIGGAVAGLGDLAASPFRDAGDSTFTQAYEESALGQWKRDLQRGYSAERKASEQELQDYIDAGNGELDKFGRAVFGAITNPRAAIGRLVQSAPAMAVSGGVGGAVGKAALARGVSTGATKWAARAGSGATEGLMSGGQAAGTVAEYNREHAYDPTRGMAAPVVTAVAAGGIGTVGGGMEAGLFNKSLREAGKASAREGWKAIPTTMVKEGFKEGGEEMAQSYFETVPTNRATDKEWNEGLGQSMGEGFAAGFGMGAALGPLSRNRKVEVMSGTEGADATYERSRPPSEAPTVDPATVAEDAGISMTGDVNADANAYIDANTEPAEEATPATGAAQPAPETTQSTPDVGVEPAAEPEASEVLQVDEKGYRKLWSGVHDQSRSVSKRLLERTNEVLATPFGKDVVDAMVQANNAVGAHLSTERILNLVDNAIDESGSVEEAIEKLRAQAADQEGRGKNSIPVSDLCAVAAEVLSGNSDPLQFLQGRMGERVVAEAQKARDKSLQKAEAKARARTGGEAPVELKGSADDVFKADDSPQVEGAPNAGVQNAPADDVIEAEIVGEREAEPANTQEEVPVNPASTTGEPVAPAEQQAAEPAVAQAVEPAPKVDTEPAPAVTAEPEPQPEPASEAPKPKAEPAPASESAPVDIDKKAPWVEEKKPVDFGPVPSVERVNHVGDKPDTAGAVPVPKEEVKPKQKRALKTKVSEIEDQKPTPNKGGQPVPAAPTKHTNAVAKGDADQRAHGKAVAAGKAMWNPNEGRKIPANEQGAKVAKSVAEMKPMESFAKAPRWVRQTREFAAKWFKIRGGWPTQEEYRDEIWPRLAEQENWTPAEMVDRRTGNAWTNRYFGDITRGSLKEPIRGTKETRRSTKQDRVDAGKRAGEAMLKEWNEQRARIQAKKDAGEELQPFEQAVLDHEKPSSADVRAYAMREHKNGNTSMRLYVRDFPPESYEATTNSKQDRKGMNWDRKGMKEVSVFKHDYKGGGKAVVKAKPSDSKASMVIANGAKENSLFTDEQKSAMELKTLERLPTREAKVEAIVDALNGIEKLPSEGTGSTRTSVTMAAIMAAQRAAQAHEHSKEHWTQEQFAQVFEAISKVLNGDKNLFTNEQLETLNNLKKQILANTQLDEGKAHDAARTGMEAAKARQAKAREVPKLVADELVADPEARAAEDAKPAKKERGEYNESEEVVEKTSESELVDDYEGDPSWYDPEGESLHGDSGSDTVGERNFGHELSGYFDDRTRIADEENTSNWDDEKVGGQSGGSINTESGRKGHFMVHGKQGLKAKLARHLKASLKWTKDLKIGEHLEEIRKRVENNEADAKAISDWFAKQAKALEPKLADMRYEDVVNLATEAGELGRAVGVGVEDNAVYQMALNEMERRATKANPQTATSVQPKATKEKPVEKAPEGFRGDKNVVLSEVGRVMPKQGLFATVERLFASLKPVTEAGKKLAEKVYFSRITEGSSFLAGGRTLQLSDIVETAKSEADLQGVFSPEFAHGLWTAISNLKAMGVTDFSNIYVVDQILDDKTGQPLTTSNNSDKARVCVGRCHLLDGEARNIAVRTGENTWNNGKLSGDTILVQAHFKGNERAYKSGLGKKADETDVAGLATHEITHAVDAKTFGALTNALKGHLNEVVHDQLEDLAMQLEELYMAWIQGKPLDAEIAALKERTGWSDKLIADAVSAMPHIYYPFMHDGERHYVELLASSVAGYATSEAYRNTINALAPKFGAALKEFIDNDLHSRNAPIADRASSPWIRIRREARNDSADAEENGTGSVRRDAQGKGESVRDGAGDSNPDGHGNEGIDGVASSGNNPQRSGADADASSSDSTRGMGDEAHSASSERNASRGRRGESDVGSVHSGEGGKGRKHPEGDMGSVAEDRADAQKRSPGSEPRSEKHGAEMGGKDSSAESRARKYFRENAKTWWGSSLLDTVLNTVDAAKTKLGLGLLFTRDLVNLACKAAPDVPAFKQWHELMERQAAYRNDWQAGVASINERFEALPKAVQPQVNRFLEAVTLEGLWPFRDPDVFATEEDFQKYKDKLSDEQKDILAKLERDYEALPQKARSVVYAVLHHGVESRRTRANLMKGFVEERYGSLIDKATDKTTKAKWEKEKKDWIARCDSLAAQVRAPYVPLRRFGSHVVVRQSKKYEYTKRLAGQVYKTIQERTNGKPTKAQMAPFHKLQAELAKMQGDPEHYEVQFVDGAGTAKRHAKTLQDRYPDAIVESFARAEHVEGSIPSWQKLEQVITSAQQNLEIEKLALDPEANDHTAASLAEIMNAAQRMYIEALNDDNARKSELRRMRVAGYHTNMMENFMETGRAEANLFANMSYGAKVRKVLVDMQQEVKHSGNRAVAADYQNEMLKRHNQMLRGEGTSEAVNALLRTNSVVMLMTSPAYYLQNLLQPMMMSAPYMAGHHGMAASMEALGKTMAAAAKALRKGTSLEHIEEGMKLTKAEAEALRRARDLGHIDIGMTSDFGHITHSDAGEIKKAFAKVTDKMTEVSRRVEMVNRIGTFIAAYRLENARLKGKNPEAAWQYADEVVYKTHGDYSGINAPRLFAMNSMTKMATQFRKFQLIQAGMMIGLAARAFRNASPAEKALARRQLAWTMGIHFAMAGAKGTPFLATLLGLIGFAFGGAGDDEDDMIRDLIGDKQTSDLVLNGIPKMLGVDMSGKVGASNMFSLFPFMDTKPSEGEDYWKDLVVSAMGPTGSLGERALRGFAYASQGDWAKGAEAVAPTGIANLMKAIRFSTEGVTTKAGDVHIPGEEFTLFDGVMQAAGLPTNKTTDRNRIMGSLIRHEEWFDGQQSQLVHDYKEAWKARDSKSMMRLRREFLELNKLRREQGFKPAKMSVMTKAPIKQRKRELQGQGIGSTVGYKPSNRRFIEEQLKK